MTGNEYQNLAMRTNDLESTGRLMKKMDMITKDFFEQLRAGEMTRNYNLGDTLNACLGLSGEVGEFNDMVKKWVFHEQELDIDHAKKELGDIAWYLAMACDSFGWNLDEILQMNVDKLKARYPEGFDTDRANHRAEGDV